MRLSQASGRLMSLPAEFPESILHRKTRRNLPPVIYGGTEGGKPTERNSLPLPPPSHPTQSLPA